jgi:hypothetical protein
MAATIAVAGPLPGTVRPVGTGRRQVEVCLKAGFKRKHAGDEIVPSTAVARMPRNTG